MQGYEEAARALSMSSPLMEFLCRKLSFSEESSDVHTLSTEDGLYDTLDGSSAELTDVFEDDFFEGEPWSPPLLELRLKVAAQLEYYLSDENLTEDAFLLKHIQKNRMGYVSLKLLTSFKKVRELTRDWRTTLAAAHCSRLLQVNEEGTKVRRRDPVPEWLLCIPTSKLLLAWNLLGDVGAEERAALGLEPPGLMERAMKLFGSYGAIASLRILRPGKELPVELRRYAKRYAELGRKVCAVVEYEQLEAARRAYEALRAAEAQPGAPGRDTRVAMLGSRGTRKPSYGQDCAAEPEGRPSQGAPRRPIRRARRTLEDSALYSSSESDFAPGSPKPVRRMTRPPSLYGSPFGIPHASFHGDPFSNPLTSPIGSPLLPRRLFSVGSHTPSPLVVPELGSSPVLAGSAVRSRCMGDCSQDGGGSPWVQRRRTAAAQTPCLMEGSPSVVGGQPRKQWPGVVVLRQPQGPDGTKGFYNCLGRGKLQLRP
ncbi:la-related protein 6b [Paramormyrops kingsleyae]|uniref:La ribonucleoprotein 6, translational regulator b n=1 Tax=Paramormyrops kingsleyae TaxID=1676925 RepID=A0A3B3R0Y3_9TELE|nr:la-related protein 6-like [Paramormyrops kingsleyae]